jgi:hypothetical protein
LDLQLEGGKTSGTSLMDIIEIHQDGDRSLSTIGSKASSIFFVQVKGIKVLYYTNEWNEKKAM